MITPEETYGRMRKLYCPRADEWLTEEHIALNENLFKITPLRLVSQETYDMIQGKLKFAEDCKLESKKCEDVESCAYWDGKINAYEQVLRVIDKDNI